MDDDNKTLMYIVVSIIVGIMSAVAIDAYKTLEMADKGYVYSSYVHMYVKDTNATIRRDSNYKETK